MFHVEHLSHKQRKQTMKAKAKKASRQKQPAKTQTGQNVPRGTFVTHTPGQLKTEIANVRLPASLAVAARKRAAFWGEGWRREQALIETETFADLDAAHEWAWARVNENVCAEVYERAAAGWEPCDNWFW